MSYKMKQIIPCESKEMTAVITFADGYEERRPVMAMALSDDGDQVLPLVADNDEGALCISPELQKDVTSVKYTFGWR